MQNNQTITTNIHHHLSTSRQMVHKLTQVILINTDYLQGIQPLSKAIHNWIKIIDLKQRVDHCPQDLKTQRNNWNIPVWDSRMTLSHQCKLDLISTPNKYCRLTYIFSQTKLPKLDIKLSGFWNDGKSLTCSHWWVQQGLYWAICKYWAGPSSLSPDNQSNRLPVRTKK